VLRAHAERPDVASVVTCPVLDPVLLAEADAMKATYVVTPASPGELLAAVRRTLHGAHDHAEPLRPPFDRRGYQRREARSSPFSGAERRAQADRRRVADTTSVPLFK
jgi:hypothetical protein